MNIFGLLKGDISQQELLNYYNCNITYIYLPKNINGFVFSYMNINNIFIDSNLSYYKKKKTVLHELAHIELHHLNQQSSDIFAFYRHQYEDEADLYIKFIINKLKEEQNYYGNN